MLIPRDVWELAATVPLPKILKTCSPSTPKTLPTSGEPFKPTEPVPSSLLQQSCAILHKSSAEAAPSQTTVEDWITEAPWVEVCTDFIIDNNSVTAMAIFQAFLNSPWLQETGAGRTKLINAIMRRKNLSLA